jgi:hypothetical protein
VIFAFWMLFELIVYVVHLLFEDVSSADGASLVFWHLINDFASELILFFDPLHEPIPVDTDKVEPVEALVNSN